MSKNSATTHFSFIAQPLKNQLALKRLVSYLRPHLWVLLAAGFAMSIVAATEAGIPWLLKPLIDDGFNNAHGTFNKWLIPTAVVVLAASRGFAQYGANYLLSWVMNRVLLQLRLEMFNRLLFARTEFFQRETASTIINAIVFEVNQVLSVLNSVLITLIRDSLMVLFLLAYLFYLNWELTLVIAVILPLIGWLVGKINKRLRRLNRQYQLETNALSYIVEETVGGYKVVKVHTGEAYEMNRFEKMSHKLRGYAMRMTIAGGMAQPITQLLASFAIAIVLMIAMMQSMHDQTTVGGFVSFVTAMLLIISPLKHLIDVNQPLQRGITAAELIFGMIDAPAEPQGGNHTCQRAKGKVSFENVKFAYHDKQTLALDTISFTVQPGEIVAFAGPSGGGKTTLVNLLPRFFNPSEGRILIDDVPIEEYQLADLRHQLAFVSQDVVLFNDTIAANVAYGQEIDREKVEKALAAAYLIETVMAMPQGLDTLVGDNGASLSGGQRQRLAIARAIYKDAPILILDEATSALDSESEQHVQAALEKLMRERTTLVIAHRLSTIERANRILVLDKGKIIEEGNHAALIEKKGLYAHLYSILYREST